MLLFPTASVNVLAATSIVVAPSADGVNVAAYTVELVALNALSAPPITVMSASAKFVVASLDVNVSTIVPSLEVPPSVTSAAVIVIVGDVLSYVQLNSVATVLLLPPPSV